MLDTVLFVVFPYVAVVLAVGGSLVRYFTRRFSGSSLPTDLVEKEWLFWGVVPWPYALVPVLLLHLGAFVVPGVMAFLHGTPTLLYLDELAGKVLALLAFVGLVVLIVRRLGRSPLRAVTSAMDWVVLLLLLNQVFLGLWVAFFYRWGAAWFIHTATPWVASLATFRPQPEYITALPLVPKLHLLNATLLIALFSFSGLVRLVTLPITYLFRRFQTTTWKRRPAQ
jgi:nitrate reductase gamma subunit